MGVTSWTNQQDQIILNGLKSAQTYAQIADNLGVTKSMVSGRIHRLRKIDPTQIPKAIPTANTQMSRLALAKKTILSYFFFHLMLTT